MKHILESYRQTYTYDVGGNVTCLVHQANSSAWQQNINIYPNNNRGTETKPSAADFDANGNLLILNHIGTLDWHYNNSLNKLTKDDKNTVEYYVYDYQDRRVRTVLESGQKKQNRRDYLPSLDILTGNKQQANTLHIGTHILAEIDKDTIQICYQLASHLQSNTLALNDQAQVVSFEHFYAYGGTALIAGKNQAQVAQKRYRYTDKERDDGSGLCYYGARYLAPWLARWINPDLVGAVDGLNLYGYVGGNPLKYTDPTGNVRVYEVNELGEPRQLDILKPVDNTYHSDQLYPYPEASQRLEETVRRYDVDKYSLLEANTVFVKNPYNGGDSIVRTSFRQGANNFLNVMDFATGELSFIINSRRSDFALTATETIAYQYVGMMKITGATGMLPKTFLRKNVSNKLAKSVMAHYRAHDDYRQFFCDFVGGTDNGRSSSRVADALGLEIVTIRLERNNVRLYLTPQRILRPLGESVTLPPREEVNKGQMMNRIIEVTKL